MPISTNSVGNLSAVRIPAEKTAELAEHLFGKGGRYSGLKVSKEIGINSNSTLWVWMRNRGTPVPVAMKIAAVLEEWAADLLRMAAELRVQARQTTQDVMETFEADLHPDTAPERQPEGFVACAGVTDESFARVTSVHLSLPPESQAPDHTPASR